MIASATLVSGWDNSEAYILQNFPKFSLRIKLHLSTVVPGLIMDPVLENVAFLFPYSFLTILLVVPVLPKYTTGSRILMTGCDSWKSN